MLLYAHGGDDKEERRDQRAHGRRHEHEIFAADRARRRISRVVDRLLVGHEAKFYKIGLESSLAVGALVPARAS